MTLFLEPETPTMTLEADFIYMRAASLPGFVIFVVECTLSIALIFNNYSFQSVVSTNN